MRAKTMVDAPKIVSEIKPGRTYIFEDRKDAFELAKKYNKQLIFTRTQPDILKEDFEFANLAANIHHMDCRNRYTLSHMVADTTNCNEENTAVIIDGLDFLVENNCFKEAYRAFVFMADFVAQNKDKDYILIAPVDKTTIEPKEYALFCSRNIVIPKKVA